ncbi:MAG: hypothetical protein HFF75_09170 [Oscillospiraceae bacterium]|nr:hypothetical protein [Oscillospiraceae bacterium]
MSRKWKIALGVLAVVVVFCLWYTRPRNFEELVGDGEFQNFSIITHTTEANTTERIKESWQFDSHGEFGAELRDILQSCEYRVSLRSLLPFSDPGPVYEDGNLTVLLSAVTGTEEGFTSMYCGGSFSSYGRFLSLVYQAKELRGAGWGWKGQVDQHGYIDLRF